ncbi:hypothetical protein F3Y22_tig00110392pilonHSYRG00193 [Hibiscus syriacus]|uniref:Uncharacterized protein n=1 Tax=Hibiscus syriacus TaxID=106335 RepID=A0A6A3AUJ7_HIBSY|nr:hypothetical protein F3Y22_tig00110392pilonHSYRG00193 [Hibiscus syriacus]
MGDSNIALSIPEKPKLLLSTKLPLFWVLLCLSCRRYRRCWIPFCLQDDALKYSAKEYKVELKPLYSAFELRPLAMKTLRSFLMFYLPLLEPATNVDEDDDDDFLKDYPEEQRADLIVPFKKCSEISCPEVPKGIAYHSVLLQGQLLTVVAAGLVQTGIVIYRFFARIKDSEEDDGVNTTKQAKLIRKKISGIAMIDICFHWSWDRCYMLKINAPKMKVILRKDGCLAAISERPVDFTDDNKWIEMDGNAMKNFHLALADENKNVLNFYFKVYRIRMINLTNSNVTSLVFDDVTAAVLQEENRRKNKEDRQVNLQQAEALTTMRGRSTECGQSSSHKHGRSKSRSKNNLKCYNCGTKGHLKKDCWSLNKNSNPQGNTANTSDDGDALCCEASTTVEGGSVYSCNDHALEIIGVGTIKLKILLDNNVSKIETRKGIMKVFRGALVVLKGEKIATNLYMLKGETLVEAEASVASCSSDSVSLPLCEHCITSKQHRLKFNTSNSRGKSVLELVHSDVWQAPITSLDEAKYFVSFIDDYSRRCWVYPIKKKSDVFSTFKIFKARVELDSGNKIKCFRTNNGGEYTSEKFDDFCRKEGFKRQFTVANTPQQNRVVERMNRTLLERTRAMLRDACLEKSFWAEAVNTGCYLVNRAPSTTIELKTPMEMWTGKPADYSNLHVFGINEYHLWDPTARKVIISRDVIFVEDKLQRKKDDDSTEKSETTQIHVENEVEEGYSSEAEPAHDEQEPESSEALPTRQSDRVRRRPNWHSDYVIEGNIAYCLLTEDVRVVLAMCATLNLHLEQLDVKTVFLHGKLEEKFYMLHPEGFEEKEKKNLVCRLNKSLYGLKQAPMCWYKRFDSFIMCLGYNRLNADPCAYFKRSDDNDFVILLLYVDDMLVAVPNKDHIEELNAQLAREFEMKDLGSANKILGMQIHRDRSNRKIWLSQKNYLKKILSRFNMQDCKPISTPLPIIFKLSSSMSPSSEEERMKMSRVPYASAVESLMCAMICTRPDIAQAVGVSVVATSTTEAEYVAATQASKEAIWLKMLLEELGHNQEYVSIFCGSQSALHLASNPTFHSRTKHIRDQYHFIPEKVEEGTVDMQKIHTKDNIADFMTNAINTDKFIWCRSSCGLSETYDFALSDSHLSQHYTSPSFNWSMDHFNFHDSLPFQLFSHAIDKNCIFLVCNGLLVFLAKYSGLICSSSMYNDDDDQSFKSYEDVPRADQSLDLEPKAPLLNDKAALGSTVDEAIKNSVEIVEEEDNKWGLEIPVEEDEEDIGESENNEEEEENGVLSTEELNKRFDEFIAKMKEELRIED